MWAEVRDELPGQMNLDEVLHFLAADTESERQAVLHVVHQRLADGDMQAQTLPKRVRVLTIHGAKGLSGRVVFIPSAEQGVMPRFKALQATGLLMENRRLFYVSVTRGMACCVISHAAQHAGASAMALTQDPVAALPHSQFLNEMGLVSTQRDAGLTEAEVGAIVDQVDDL